MSERWTKAQRTAIESVGGGILVSAAAGSGKTSVLAERCAHLVCGAKEACEIGQVLVVTFTESAAAEMKGRIMEALRKRAGDRPTGRMARQLALAEHANISTLHAFCARLLRQHFDRAGLDPQFRILDGDEADLMKWSVAEDLFERKFEEDASGDFARLVDMAGDGETRGPMEAMLGLHNTLGSLVEPDAWMARTLAEICEPGELMKRLAAAIEEKLDAVERSRREAVRVIGGLGGAFADYVTFLQGAGATLAHWKDVLRNDGPSMLVGEFRDYHLNTIPIASKSNSLPNKELAKGTLDGVRDAMKDESSLGELLAFTQEQWREGMLAIAGPAGTFLELVREFGRDYTAAKKSARALDFGDLERRTLDLLVDEKGNATPVARGLHRQFKCVLVDEYQDINQLQDRILHWVSHENAADRASNLFCVGDVKQSIFRFRLAEPKRFLERMRKFQAKGSGNQVILLSENFRSTPGLVNGINGVFEKLMTEETAQIQYNPHHRLMAGLTDAKDGGPVELHLPASEREEVGEEDDLDQTDREAILTARRILELTKSGEYGFGDVAVILRTMQFKAEAFADVLRRHDIPVHTEGGAGFFDAREIRDMLALLAVLDNRKQDIALAAVLRGPMVDFAGADEKLARVHAKYSGEEIAFHEKVALYARQETDETAAQLRKVIEQLDAWRDEANKRPIAGLVWYLYESTGFLAYCAGLEDGRQRETNLLELHRRAVQFGQFLRQGLRRFLQFVESLRERKEIAQPSVAQGKPAVRILSIHKAKGQQFPVVIVPDLGKKFNMQDTSGQIVFDREAGLGMDVVDEERRVRYPSLASTLVREGIQKATMAEEMRLLYVAMTRAERKLILIGSVKEKTVQGWKNQTTTASQARSMLDWVGSVWGSTPGLIQEKRYSREDMAAWPNPFAKREEGSERQKKAAKLERMQGTGGEELIARFSVGYRHAPETLRAASAAVTTLAKGDSAATFSAIGMTRKLDLPGFFVREAAPKATDIGDAVHLALEHWDFSAGEAAIETQIAKLVERKILSPAQGRQVDTPSIQWFLATDLGKFLANHAAEVMREVSFAVMHGEGQGLDRVMVRGRIDLLVPMQGGVAVVDYKTDRVSGQEIDRRVEVYRPQVEFYRQAIEQTAKQKVTGIFLVFLAGRRVVQV